ncbi:MAG TPA: hypothetical protein VGM91_06100 [Conexibacter sp.]|jgi:hypothetical protein
MESNGDPGIGSGPVSGLDVASPAAATAAAATTRSGRRGWWPELTGSATGPRTGRGLMVELLLLAVGAALVAVVMHLPLVFHLGSDVAKDLGDPLPQAWQVAWDGHALLHQPLHFFDSNQFYPYKDTLAFSDALLGYAPAGLIGHGPFATIVRYDLLYLFAYALAFVGSYLLARTLGASPAAAAVAGAAFAFSPWRLEQAGHLHVISSGGIPLALALFVRGARRRSAGTILAGWVVATWQLSLGWTLGLQLAYLLLAIAIVLAARWWFARRASARETWSAARAAIAGLPTGMIVATVAGLLLFAVVGISVGRVYLHVASVFSGAKRGPELVSNYSGTPIEFLVAGRDSFVWSGVTASLRGSLQAFPEKALFPGLVVLLLAIFGAVHGLWPRSLRRWLAIAVIVCAALSLGYTDAKLRLLFPYGWLSALPGWDAIRTPGRLMTLTTLALALLAAAGAQRLQQRWRWAPLALMALVLIEGSAFSIGHGGISGPPHPTVPRPPAGLSAATPPMLELPMEADDNRRYLLWSTDGFPKLVNGRSSLNPLTFLALHSEVQEFPSRAAVARLQQLGVRTVVLNRSRLSGSPWAGWRERPWRSLGISRELRGDVVLYRIPPVER